MDTSNKAFDYDLAEKFIREKFPLQFIKDEFDLQNFYSNFCEENDAVLKKFIQVRKTLRELNIEDETESIYWKYMEKNWTFDFLKKTFGFYLINNGQTHVRNIKQK